MADENKLQALRISPGFLDNLQKERNLSDTECKILHYFETCGEWQPQDPTIVSHWYWWRIPTLAMH